VFSESVMDRGRAAPSLPPALIDVIRPCPRRVRVRFLVAHPEPPEHRPIVSTRLRRPSRRSRRRTRARVSRTDPRFRAPRAVPGCDGHGGRRLLQDADASLDPLDWPDVLQPILDGRADLSSCPGRSARRVAGATRGANRLWRASCPAQAARPLTDLGPMRAAAHRLSSWGSPTAASAAPGDVLRAPARAADRRGRGDLPPRVGARRSPSPYA